MWGVERDGWHRGECASTLGEVSSGHPTLEGGFFASVNGYIFVTRTAPRRERRSDRSVVVGFRSYDGLGF
jgi:hypothetical protein